jgi:hypothetical protein
MPRDIDGGAVAPSEDRAAGAPEDEIEVTPEMIEAGLEYMESTALNTLSTRVMTPEFVIEFYRAMESRRCGGL